MAIAEEALSVALPLSLRQFASLFESFASSKRECAAPSSHRVFILVRNKSNVTVEMSEGIFSAHGPSILICFLTLINVQRDTSQILGSWVPLGMRAR
jgi:hypothetical protein